jgi:BirA family biotin operon repressor/biotin-[acetyl-CoA-carboxylase] ligase
MNPSLPILLNLLSDGEFHSGSSIGSVIGVSRTAVWKHLQKLAEVGLSVESVKGRGYRLVGGIELLSADVIQSLMDNSAQDKLSCIDVVMSVDSTNSMAMSRALEPGANGYVCLAEYQTAGRGRRGRQWLSPFGHNVYLSVVWEFEGGALQLEGLSLAVGVVIARVLKKMGLQDLSLKWPNDILLGQSKLGGVLLEMSGDPSGLCRVVIGIGINVRMADDVEIDQPWSTVTQQLPDVSRNQLVANLLNELMPMLFEYSELGFSALRGEWEQYDAYQGQLVSVIAGDSVQQGIARGVFDNGALRLLLDDQEKAIYGGEVSLRVACDS